MIDFSITTVLMAVLTSNLLIIILAVIFMNKDMIIKSGFQLLGVFCMLIFIRMLVPVEFSNVVSNINFPLWISKLLVIIRHSGIKLCGHSFSVWDIFVVVWGAGFVILFSWYISTIRDRYKYNCNYGTDVTDNPVYRSVVDKVCTRKEIKKRISVLKFSTPQEISVFQYHFHYYILLPDGLHLDEKELELVFRHEMSHILHHDMTAKFILQIICLFYWWNPFCSVLMKQSNLLFEVRIDSSIAAAGKEEIKKYVDCIIKVAQHDISSKEKFKTTMGLSAQKSTALYKRCYYILKNEEKKNRLLVKIILIPVCLLYLLSFVFTFESCYMYPEDVEMGEIMTSENTYIVKNDSGAYDIYFYGEYFETVGVDLLEYYPDGCKVYQSLEEAEEYCK